MCVDSLQLLSLLLMLFLVKEMEMVSLRLRVAEQIELCCFFVACFDFMRPTMR
jgi:hypothetical protein